MLICGSWKSLRESKEKAEIRTALSCGDCMWKWNGEKMKQRIYFSRRLWHLTCKCYGFIQYVAKVGVITFEYFYCAALVLKSRDATTRIFLVFPTIELKFFIGSPWFILCKCTTSKLFFIAQYCANLTTKMDESDDGCSVHYRESLHEIYGFQRYRCNLYLEQEEWNWTVASARWCGCVNSGGVINFGKRSIYIHLGSAFSDFRRYFLLLVSEAGL